MDEDRLENDWERERFEVETQLRREEIEIEKSKQEIEKRRLRYVGIGVPLVLAIVAAAPLATNSFFQYRLELKKFDIENTKSGKKFEKEIMTKIITENNPTIAGEKLLALKVSGILENTTDNMILEIINSLNGKCSTNSLLSISKRIEC